HRREPNPVALILVPTRELAVQVSEAIHRYGKELGTRVLPIYGGQPIVRQLRILERGVDVVVATPGRALDHIARKTLRLDQLETVVLDEADEMLDMGFAEDIEAILAETPKTRQTVLFSATLPPRIDKIARKHLRDPSRIQMGRESTAEGKHPSYGRARTSLPARTSRRPWAESWTSRRPRPRWCSAVPAPKSTSWPNNSMAVATGPRRCTAGWTRLSAIG
ncbi:MAG: DEAD/DEAH box helicase, partial [Geodermatophilaceae bacterium]